MTQTLHLSSAIDAAREFIKATNGIVHVDPVLYPLFIQALYPDYVTHIESFIELLYQVWLDPSPEYIVFLPEFMQDKYVPLPNFREVVALVYPDDHHEKTAFLEIMHDQISSSSITIFAAETKAKQCQKIVTQGVRIAGIEDATDHDGPHIVVLTYRQILPIYNGETHTILIEEKKGVVSNSGCHPRVAEDPLSNGKPILLPAVLPIQSIKLLFNDPELFYERYVLNVRSPYQPTHHVSTKALKEFLLFDKPIKAKTAFDRHQIDTIKREWDKFVATLPKDVIWNKEVYSDVPNTNQTLHGTIDLIWNDGLYQLTKRTPPARSALLNGIEPELPLLASAYTCPITHVGYIHLQGHGEDVISVTRYNDPSALASENIQKLAHIHTRSQKESS